MSYNQAIFLDIVWTICHHCSIHGERAPLLMERRYKWFGRVFMFKTLWRKPIMTWQGAIKFPQRIHSPNLTLHCQIMILKLVKTSETRSSISLHFSTASREGAFEIVLGCCHKNQDCSYRAASLPWSQFLWYSIRKRWRSCHCSSIKKTLVFPVPGKTLPYLLAILWWIISVVQLDEI